MHTLIVIAGGLLLLAICLAAGRWIGGAGAAGMITAAKIFVPIWLAAALVNLWIGVSRAGYSIGDELPIFLLVFAVPAAAALIVWWKLS
ncbi:MAG TPA: hypothetical protein VGA51_05645 [Casimicrobiaceae bacterium]